MLQKFADKHRLTIRRSDDDGTAVISSNLGQLYEYSETELAVMFMPAEPQMRRWASVKRKCLASGMTPRQIGDYEGAFSFDPADMRQVKTALHVINVRRKKCISPDHLRALREGLFRTTHNSEKVPSADPLQAPGFDEQISNSTSGPPNGLQTF
jgi:hypothetical protein